MLGTAFPGRHVAEFHPLSLGLRNANLKVTFHSHPEPVVLRIYQHDPSLCQKEMDLLRLVHGSVPVPHVVHAAPLGLEELPPYAVLQFVEGVTPLDLKRSGDLTAFAEVAASAGEVLAAIGRTRFEKPGWLAPGPAVTAPLLEGPDALPRFVDRCLDNPYLKKRVPPDLCDRINNVMWHWASRLAELDGETHLVHCDFSRRNMIARPVNGRWTVVAVLDWEFAVSSTPLIDVANFLRYELTARPLAEPHFSTAFQRAGGVLGEDWRRLSRVIDLTAICESLTREELPDDVSKELLELMRAVPEHRDPQL
jgi:aminoglycoside phosphotransferase (APT) family kinase protein